LVTVKLMPSLAVISPLVFDTVMVAVYPPAGRSALGCTVNVSVPPTDRLAIDAPDSVKLDAAAPESSTESGPVSTAPVLVTVTNFAAGCV